MKKYWLIKIYTEFMAIEEKTNKAVIFRNWRENVIDVMAANIEQAKATAALTGILEGTHYNDVVEQEDWI